MSFAPVSQLLDGGFGIPSAVRVTATDDVIAARMLLGEVVLFAPSASEANVAQLHREVAVAAAAHAVDVTGAVTALAAPDVKAAMNKALADGPATDRIDGSVPAPLVSLTAGIRPWPLGWGHRQQLW